MMHNLVMKVYPGEPTPGVKGECERLREHRLAPDR